MSDRIAVFNHGRIEQVGAPAEVYERPATRFVAGFVGTSNLLTGDAAEAIVGAARHVHGPAREDPPRRPGRRARGGRGVARAGTIREVVYLGPDTRYYRGARRGRRARRHPAEPRDDLDRGARAAGPARSGCIWKRQHDASPVDGRGPIDAEEDQSTRQQHRIGGSLAALAGGRGARGRGLSAAWRRAGSPGPEPDDAPIGDGEGERQGPGLARATSRTARPARTSTGSAASRRRPAARSPSRPSGRRTRRSACSRRTPSSTTSSRRPATRACGSSPAATSSRSTST